MNELYLVLTQEVFAGDEGRFFTDTKLFTMRQDAENYFNEQDQEFCRLQATTDEDGETVYPWEDEAHDTDLHEYWYHGTSHHRSEIITLNAK